MQVEIELRPHKGIQQTELGPVEVELKQWLVMAKTNWLVDRWLHVGYVCYPCSANPSPPFNGLESFRKLPEAYKQQIADQVRAKVGTAAMRVHEPPEPVVIEDDDDDDSPRIILP